jgi:hypothetical protein
MLNGRQMVLGAALVGLACTLPGCRLAPMSSGPLSGLMASHHDRAVADQASKSSFPSPSDVGLASGPSDDRKAR